MVVSTGWLRSELVVPANATRNWSSPNCTTRYATSPRTNTVTNPASTASSSWRPRRRAIRSTLAAIGNARLPRPLVQFSRVTATEPRRLDASDRSASSPDVVLVAKYAKSTVPAMATSTMSRRTRSVGRRTRGGMTPSSMTSVVCAGASDGGTGSAGLKGSLAAAGRADSGTIGAGDSVLMSATWESCQTARS